MNYTVYGILQARTLEWVVVPSPGDLPDPGIEPRSPALQADSLPGEPTREAQEYWSGQHIPSPGDLPNPGIKRGSPALQVGLILYQVPGKSFATSCTIACQAPLSMGFLRQEYWSELPFSSLEVLPNPGIEPTSPVSPALQVHFLQLCHQGSLLLLINKSKMPRNLVL